MDDLIPEETKGVKSRVSPTGKLRIKDGVLQQQFSQHWSGKDRDVTRKRWRDVPVIVSQQPDP